MYAIEVVPLDAVKYNLNHVIIESEYKSFYGCIRAKRQQICRKKMRE